MTGVPSPGEPAPVIVLLAAGESRRYGGVKQLAHLNGEAMVHRSARIALETGAPVLAITGANDEAVEAALADLPLVVVRHRAWREGMGSSLAAGIGQVRVQYPSASGALVCLADQPLFDSAWLEQLMAAHRRRPDMLMVTEAKGVPGPPVVFPGDLFDELAQWSGSKGAQAVLRREAHRVLRFASSAGIDVDTPDDLRRARELLGARRPE